MKKCSSCQVPVSYQRLFHKSATVCFRCYCVGFTQSTFEWLVSPVFVKSFNQIAQQQSPSYGKPCFFCAHPTRTIPIGPGPERIENLKIFNHWKYWYKHHKEGKLQVSFCPQCGSCWVNARTLCQLPIDWKALEVQFRELWKTKQDQDEFGLPTEPIEAAIVMFFGIPYLENVPTLSEMPYWTYVTALSVFGVTKFVFARSHLLPWFVLVPSQPTPLLLKSMITYSLVHANWAHCLGNLAFFLVFSPLVEHELGKSRFLLLLLLSAIGSAGFQTLLYPTALLGFSGVVSAIIAFFCTRFPSAVIGMGMMRFAAPVALAIYIGNDLISTLQMLTGSGNVAGLAHLGGAAVGYLFHLFSPTGESKKKFQKMSTDLVDHEKSVRNWNQ